MTTCSVILWFLQLDQCNRIVRPEYEQGQKAYEIRAEAVQAHRENWVPAREDVALMVVCLAIFSSTIRF